MVKRTTALRRSRGLLLCELCNGGRYLRTFQWEISSPRTQVSFQFFAICIILNIYKRFMLKKLGNRNKNFRRSSTLKGLSFRDRDSFEVISEHCLPRFPASLQVCSFSRNDSFRKMAVPVLFTPCIPKRS